MSINKVKRDRQFPLFVHTIPIRRLFDNPKKFCHYVTSGQVVADIGCGAGYYTFALAECVGPKGKVYAVELNEKAIRALEKRRINVVITTSKPLLHLPLT